MSVLTEEPAVLIPSKRMEPKPLRSAVLMGLSEKKSIINQVIDGQIKVWEAADRFRVAQSHTSACMERTTGVPNRVIDTELLCRTIIGWVDLALRDHPERAEFITSKLENELATYLHSGKSRRQADR